MEKWELTVRLGLDLRTATDQDILDAILKANPEAGPQFTKLKTHLPYRKDAVTGHPPGREDKHNGRRN